MGWNAATHPTNPRTAFGGTYNPSNNKVYIVCGTHRPGGTVTATNTLSEYDVATETWAAKANAPFNAYHNRSHALNGLIYSCFTNDLGGVRRADFSSYDPSTNSWTSRANIPAITTYPASGVIEGHFVFAGGSPDGNASTAFATVRAYNPATNSWSTRASLPEARMQCSSAVLNNKLYVLGGYRPSPVELTNTLYEYTWSTNTWTTRASVPFSARIFLSTGIDGKLYAADSVGPTGSTTFYSWDSATNVWTTESSNPLPRGAAYTQGYVSSYGKIYLFAGSVSINTAWDVATTSYISDPFVNEVPNTPTDLVVTSASADNTPTFSASVSDPDAGDEVKSRFEVSTSAGSIVGTVDSGFVTDSGTVTAEYATALNVGEYRVRAKSIDTAGDESAYTDYINFNISSFASGIGGFITKGTVPTKTQAQGRWSVNDVHGYKDNDQWPTA